MELGTLVRVNLPFIGGASRHPNSYHDQVGIILDEVKRGPYRVFVVLLQSGRKQSFQASSLEVLQ